MIIFYKATCPHCIGPSFLAHIILHCRDPSVCAVTVVFSDVIIIKICRHRTVRTVPNIRTTRYWTHSGVLYVLKGTLCTVLYILSVVGIIF